MGESGGAAALVEAIASSNKDNALEAARQMSPMEAHKAMFPVSQTVLNPPYPNPHLPKMHSAIHELFLYLEPEDIPALVALEASEYSRRPKMELPPRKEAKGSLDSFWARVGDGDATGAAYALAAEWRRDRGRTVASLVTSGGGHLNSTLGHSVSCMSLILRDAGQQDDPWPAIARIAYYHVEAGLGKAEQVPAEAISVDDLSARLLNATLGSGIGELHDTITLWGTEQSRYALSPTEWYGLVAQWADYVGDKEGEPYHAEKTEALRSYEDFNEVFSGSRAGPVVDALMSLSTGIGSGNKMGRYLVKGVCDAYTGSCDPHHITGLASALWTAKAFPARPEIVASALHQYLSFYFGSRT